MTFFEHLLQLKHKLLYTGIVFIAVFATCYYFVESIYSFLLAPLEAYYKHKNQQGYLIYTGLTEAFFTYLQLAFYSALFITLPLLLCQIYSFIAPALYKKEKKILLPYLIVAPILFLLGAAFVYYYIFPTAWSFFLSFENPANTASMPLKLEARVSEYLSLVMQLILVFGLAFQLPVLLTLLVRFNILSIESLKRKRRFAIILIFIIAAIVTPPDAFSQIGLALVMILLYELSIMACKIVSSKD